ARFISLPPSNDLVVNRQRCTGTTAIPIRVQQHHAGYPISHTLRPAPAIVLPIWSMSMVISASSASAVSEITAGVAAVVEVFSPASMVSFVDRIDDPDSLISTVKAASVGAVPTVARTPVSVNANGIRNVAFAVPVVRAVVSSEQAMPRAVVRTSLIVLPPS